MDDVELDLDMDSSPESDLMQPVVASPATPKRPQLGGKPTSMAQLSAAMSRRSKSPASSAGSKTSRGGRPKRKANSVATPKYAQSPTSSTHSSGSNKRTHADMSKDEGTGTSKGNKGKRKPKTKSKKLKVSNSDPNRGLVGKVNEEEYIVEKIVGKKQITTEHGRQAHYFIKWKGWANSNNTWEPVENLDGCQELLDEYERGLKQKRAKSGKKHVEESEGESDKDKAFEEAMDETRKELMEYGVITTKWPADVIPLEVAGIITVEGHLCYIIKTQTEKPMKYISAVNCSVVRAKVFCYDFPHIVISYYEKNMVWANRLEPDSELGRKAAKAIHAHRAGPKSKKKNAATAAATSTAAGDKENANNAAVEEDNDSEEDGIENIKTGGDEQQTIFIKPDVDLFGLPDNLDDSDSSSGSDIFVQIPLKTKSKNKIKKRK